MITISIKLLREAEHRIDIGEIDGCNCCIYRNDCMGVYSVGGEPQFPFCTDATLDEHFDLEAYREIIKEEWNDMSLLEKICKELNITINEEWLANDGNQYIINEEGAIFQVDKPMLTEVVQSNWKRLVRGDLQPVWKPKDGDVFYVPDVLSWEKSEMFLCFDWKDNEYNQELLSKKLVFRTKEEAMICTHKMLEAIKE